MIIEQIFEKRSLQIPKNKSLRFIEQNPRHVVNLSLEEFSDQCYVSRPLSSGSAKNWVLKVFQILKSVWRKA